MAELGGYAGTWKHGTHGALTTLTNLTSYVYSVDNPFETDMLDTTKFGATARSFTPGLSQSTVTVVYEYHVTLIGYLNDIYSNKEGVSFENSPVGTATGKPKVTGTVYIQNISSPVEVGTDLRVTVTYQVSGSVTFASHS